MNEQLVDVLAIGGHANSLGRVNDVINYVIANKSRLAELYDCMHHDDAWVRIRAADAFEKICRLHPEWLVPYIEQCINELSVTKQPSIQWHLAQIYRQVELTATQRRSVVKWLKHLLSSAEVDWIVAANAMDTLAKFASDGDISATEFRKLIKIQLAHKSNAVVKRANKLLLELDAKS